MGNDNEQNVSADGMREDWDARARQNPYYFAASGREDWTPAEFFESGRKSVQELIVSDLDQVTQGRDPKQLRVLELGCGPGRMTQALAELFGEVFALDVSGEMLACARTAVRDAPNVVLCRNNGRDLSMLASGRFDFVFSFIVFQHIPSVDVIESYVTEVSRVLKPGGVFKFQVQGAWQPGRRPRDSWQSASVSAPAVLDWLDPYGFELLGATGVGTQYFWIWLRKPNPSDPSAAETRMPLPGRVSRQQRLLVNQVEMLRAELESRTSWAERLDLELEAMRVYLRRIYVSIAYRVGRRLKLAPEPFEYDENNPGS